MEQQSDSRLVELARGGDGSAFAELFHRYYAAVYDFAARMMRDAGEAEDVAHETFRDAMALMGGMGPNATFRGWIFSIARNLALDRLDGRSAMGPRADGTREPAFSVLDTQSLASPDAAEAQALAPLVWEAAAALDDRQLSLLVLHLRQHLDEAEMAQVIGVPEEHAPLILARLVKAARGAMQDVVLALDSGYRCEGLEALIGPHAEAGLPAATRRAIEAHAADCERCARRREAVATLALFSAFAMVDPPPGSVDGILDDLLAAWPGSSPALAGHAPLGVPPLRMRDQGSERRDPCVIRAFAGLGALAAVLLAVLVLPASPISLTRFGSAGRFATARAGTEPAGSSPTAPAVLGVVGTATAVPSRAATSRPATGGSPPPQTTSDAQLGAPTPANTETPVATATATPSSAPTATPAAPGPTPTMAPTATPAGTPTPCRAVLTSNLSALNVSNGSNSFEVLNQSPCDSGPYSVSSSATWLTLDRKAGDVGPFAHQTINVVADTSAVREGTTTAPIEVTWATGSFTVQARVTKVGAPPVILQATGTCTPNSATVTASATDDYGVASVAVSYVLDDGTAGGPVQLALVSGSARSGNWSATFSVPRPLRSFTVTATDGAGQTASATGTCG